jgi:hypothetical protein
MSDKYTPTAEDIANPCCKCKVIYDGKMDMIACDNCSTNWIHLKCAGLKRVPVDEESYHCLECVKQAKQNRTQLETTDEHLVKLNENGNADHHFDSLTKTIDDLKHIIEQQQDMLNRVFESKDMQSTEQKKN